MPRRLANLSFSYSPASSSATPDSDSMTARATEQPSTPATSQSDVSGTLDSMADCKEEAVPVETGTTRRSRRVTRSSMASVVKNGGGEELVQLETGVDDAGVDEVGETGEAVQRGKRVLRTRASLNAVVDKQKGSEVETKDVSLVKESLEEKAGQETPKQASTAKLQANHDKTTRRRSTRISLLDKAKDAVEKAPSVLGKRERGKGKGQDKSGGKRASLRPRDTIKTPEKPTEPEKPPPKKQRTAVSDAPASKDDAPETTMEKTKPVSIRKQKYWLTHGLYAAENTYRRKAVLTNPNRKAKKGEDTSDTERKLLPLPKHNGARLLEVGRDFKLPFDIFSPLPPGQPKPDEWRKTNKNVFVGDAASIWKATKLTEMSTCTCTRETGCDEDCQNRFMFYECDETNCKLPEELCGNRSFSGLRQRCKAGGKFNIGVEVIKTKDRGYGVRSNRCFEPNQIIVEYAGEIITQAECERRMRTTYKDNECYYLMYFDQNMIIDATRGSIARFVNHSCEPNCRMEKWTVAGKPRMALFAGENGIMTGEELSYDYNFDPYSNKNVQKCRCGAPTCRGILGPRPKDGKEKPKKVETPKRKVKPAASSTAKSTTTSKQSGTKRKAESVLDESTSRLNKKQKTAGTAKAAQRVKAGLKKVVSKALPSTKRATATKAKTTEKKVKKTTTTKKSEKKSEKKTKPKNEKETAPTKKANGNAKQKQQTKAGQNSSAAKGSKRPAPTLAGGLANGTRLRMPGKPRLANSIAAARESKGTPAPMKAFLEQGKKLQGSTKKTKTVHENGGDGKTGSRPRTRNSLGGK